MTSWCRKNLGDAMLANEALSVIETHLANVYELHSKPENWLAIYRHESQGLHCSVIVYITNNFQQFATLDNAIICDQPPLSDSAFLSGDEGRFHRV